MLELRDVSTRYGPITMLRRVSLTLADGTIASLLGPNGAGKTTLIRTILGIVRPVEGSIWLDGRRIDRLRTHEIVELGIGVVPEGRRVFPKMTVEENLRMGAFIEWAPADFAARRDHVFALFPRLAERRRQKAATMSGGEQAMLAMGRALMGRPKLLLLDEPSLGLAPIISQQIFRTVRELNAKEGVTVLIVEQNAHAALGLASRAYVLETGAVTMSGDAKQLLEDPRVKAAYLGE